MNTPQTPGPDDPRYGFAVVTDALGSLMASVPDTAIGNATPCPDFTVKELLEHIVLVMRRVATIGKGEHWSTVNEEPTDSGWHDDYRAAAHDVMQVWTDPALLERELEVPWGAFPGALLMYTYTAELAVHGWDLAQATGADFAIDDAALEGAWVAIQYIPAEGRETPEVPFGPVVDPGADAPALDRLAGWAGRRVLG